MVHSLELEREKLFPFLCIKFAAFRFGLSGFAPITSELWSSMVVSTKKKYMFSFNVSQYFFYDEVL